MMIMIMMLMIMLVIAMIDNDHCYHNHDLWYYADCFLLLISLIFHSVIYLRFPSFVCRVIFLPFHYSFN